jgi:Na+/glutamate symporter
MADSWVPVVVVIVAAVFGFVGVIIGGIVTGWFTIRAERLRAEQAEAREHQTGKPCSGDGARDCSKNLILDSILVKLKVRRRMVCRVAHKKTLKCFGLH